MGKQFAFFALYDKLTKITDVIGEISLIKDDCLGGPTVDDWKDTEELENLAGQLDVLLADEVLTPLIDGPLSRVFNAVVAIRRWVDAEDWLRDTDASDERLEQSVKLLEEGWQETDQFIRRMAQRAFGYWGAEFFNFLEYDERLEIIRESIPQSESVDLEPLLSADDVPDEPVDVPPQKLWTPLQREILILLDGRAMTKKELAEKLWGGEDRGRQLYRKGALYELMEHGMVENTTGVGYWRSDSPPRDLINRLFPDIRGDATVVGPDEPPGGDEDLLY